MDQLDIDELDSNQNVENLMDGKLDDEIEPEDDSARVTVCGNLDTLLENEKDLECDKLPTNEITDVTDYLSRITKE